MSAPYESHGRIMCFHAGCKKTTILLRDKFLNRHFQKSPVAVFVKTTQIFQCTLWPWRPEFPNRRKIRLIEVNAKCPHLKILTCNGTLRQVFTRVYRLEIANFLRTFSHVGIFNPALCSVLSPVAPLPFSLVQLSSPPSFPGWISILYVYSV
jgi:hypothetical protein